MVYLNDNTYTQRVAIPRSTANGTGAYVLTITSCIGNGVQEFAVEDKSDTPLFYYFDIALAEGSPRGEYRYEVSQGGEVTASGILIVETEAYHPAQNEEKIEFVQYD